MGSKETIDLVSSGGVVYHEIYYKNMFNPIRQVCIGI